MAEGFLGKGVFEVASILGVCEEQPRKGSAKFTNQMAFFLEEGDSIGNRLRRRSNRTIDINDAGNRGGK